MEELGTEPTQQLNCPNLTIVSTEKKNAKDWNISTVHCDVQWHIEWSMNNTVELSVMFTQLMHIQNKLISTEMSVKYIVEISIQNVAYQ